MTMIRKVESNPVPEVSIAREGKYERPRGVSKQQPSGPPCGVEVGDSTQPHAGLHKPLVVVVVSFGRKANPTRALWFEGASFGSEMR